MSKSAIIFINATVSGACAEFLTGLVNDKAVRKAGQWRNADVFARFLVDTVCNAYQCENSTTFKANGFRDMQHAIESYVMSNLDEWNARQWADRCTAEAVAARLARVCSENRRFESSLAKAPEVTAWEVVENGPDSTDYVVGVFSSQHCAQQRADACTARDGYLGYGYTVRPCTDGLTDAQRYIMRERAHHTARLCKKHDTPSQRLACELEAYDMQHAIINVRHHMEYLASVGAAPELDVMENQLCQLFGYADAKRIIKAASK